MLPIPAIDLRGGKCVRLRQGDYGQETIFGNDPVAVACRWVDEGARALHLVDLDGAKAGRPVNTAVVAQIARAAGVPCQLGGGLRDQAAIEEALALGVERVILGTRAVRDPDWLSEMAGRYPAKVVVGLDAKNGLVATEGWIEVSSLTAIEIARRCALLPLAAIVYTDVAKDGMMAGPNFEATSALAAATRHPVIASGGVTTIEDVLELRRRGIGACILGRTIYEGSMKLRELFARLARD